MAMKQIAQRLQPMPLYFILGLTVCLFLLELVVAHLTHSLTLLLDAYHALCNIVVLFGSIISIKHGSSHSDRATNTSISQNSQEELKSLASVRHQTQMCCASRPGPERQLRNTFGWARVDVVVMLIGCVFLASLCFSVLVEALQTLVHISHHDEMHRPIVVLAIGLLDLVLNLLAFSLIGGYTFHQGSFLMPLRESGVDVTPAEAQGCQSNSQKQVLGANPIRSEKRQGFWGLCRDCVGCLVVIICSVIVYCTESGVAKYVDPAFSILSAVLVLLLSYPFMKESCLILLQTIPDHINIGSLCSQLLTAFPDVVNVHELHVWRLTVGKTYCTAHIIFLNPKEYARITDDISRFFLGQGITHVTIQPEFYKDANSLDLVSSGSSDCLVQCTEDLCMERHCCASRSPSLESVHIHGDHTHMHRRKMSPSLRSGSCEKSSSSFSNNRDPVLEVASSCAFQLGEVSAQSSPSVSADHSRAEDLVSNRAESAEEVSNLSSSYAVSSVHRETSDV